MKVAVVCPYDWSYPGGVKTHITGLAGALRSKGVEVEIIAPASRPEPGIFAAGKTVGIPFNGSVARVCLSPGARNKIKARLQQGDLDLLHIHEPASPSVGLIALATARIPVVATFHAAAAGSAAYAAARPLLGRLFDKLSVRIAVSSEARRLVSAYFPADYTLIPNGIDLGLYRSAETRDDLKKQKPFVLFVGRDEPRKGLGVLVEAIKQLRLSADVRLVVAGMTSDALPFWTTALGSVSPEELPSIYKSADVFCAPSLRGESFGLVLAEAMAAGVPVVCSDLPGYREAAGGAAAMFPPADAKAASKKLEEIITDRHKAEDLIARGAVRAAELDWSVLAGQVLACYDRALS